MILAIDPGPEQSAFIRSDDGLCQLDHGIVSNADMRHVIDDCATYGTDPHLVIEQISSFGLAVGREVFETCVWTGRFMERFSAITDLEAVRIPRLNIKVHLCGSARAKDANVRQALIDRFGGLAAIRKGKKEKRNRKGEIVTPAVEAGPLAGITSHVWSALAVAVVFADLRKVGAL